MRSGDPFKRRCWRRSFSDVSARRVSRCHGRRCLAPHEDQRMLHNQVHLYSVSTRNLTLCIPYSESIILRLMEAKKLQALFGRRVRSARNLCDLTQEELAEKSGLSPEYISLIERGLTSPSFGTITRLCTALDLAPRDLFDFTNLRDR